MNDSGDLEPDEAVAAAPPRIRSFVVRAGRIGPGQARALATLAPRFVVPFVATPVDFAQVFGRVAPLAVEIGFGMGSATAATVMDLLSAINPEAVLFLGKCGGLKHRAKIGSLILPIAAIRGEGTSNDYFPAEVPALPAFALQKAISTTIRDCARDYWTGTVYTTNRRVWEHDEEFKTYLTKIRALCIDMETATIFMTGFFNEIPTGALLLVSDQPMTPEGVKTADSDKQVDEKFVKDHLRIGIDSLKQLINQGLTVKHLKF